MREYIVSVTFGILFCMGINLLIPNKRYAGIMQIICGVFVVYILIAPLNKILNLSAPELDFSGYLKDEEFTENSLRAREKFTKELEHSTINATEELLQKDIENEFGITVKVTIEKGEIHIDGVGKEKSEEVAEYIKSKHRLDAYVR